MEKDLQCESEKIAKYAGTARVQLRWLFFQDGEVNAKHVQVLESSFKVDCRRLDVRNRIPAVIDQQDLDSASQLSGISKEDLLQTSQHQIPELGFWVGYQLRCLHGRHRVQAAKLALTASNKWWVVDLYLADISSDLRTVLTEEYANEEKPPDGEVYWKIRKYRREKQAGLEGRWWTRISPHKASNLRQLFQHNDFTTAFDSFLELPGVLTGLRISTLHKMFAIRCDEEILHYLRYIKDFWTELLQEDRSAMAKVDQVTVEELQLRAPWASTMDAKVLRSKVLGGELFRLLTQQEREQIWIKLQNFKGIIPSLFELFENLKCLEAWANCLKWLLRLDPQETLLMAIKRIYSDRDQAKDSALVQESETIFESVPASMQDRLNLGYRQLYSFAIRYHRDIPKKSTRKDLLARPSPTIDTARLREMADLARRLGFESPEITALREHPKPDCAVVTGSHRPCLVTDGPGQAKRYRCGLPRVEDYEENRQYMFINYLHENRHEQGEGITCFFLFRSMYLKFFGMPLSRPSHSGAVNIDFQQPGIAVEEALEFPTSDTIRVADTSECDRLHDPDAINIDRDMNDVEESEDPIPTQEPEQFLRTSISREQEHHQERIRQIRQQLAQEENALKIQDQAQQQLRHKLNSTACALQEQEHTQEQRRQKLTEEENALNIQEQKNSRLGQQVHLNAEVLKEQKHQQEQMRQRLSQEQNTLKAQERKSYEASQLVSSERAFTSNRYDTPSDASSVLMPAEEGQERYKLEYTRRQAEKQPRRLKRERQKQRIELPRTNIGGRKEDDLRISHEQEERLHENAQSHSHEGLQNVQVLENSHQGEPTDALITQGAGIEYQSAARARIHEATPKYQQGCRMRPHSCNEHQIGEDQATQYQPEVGLTSDKAQQRTKRAREEVDDSEDEVRARQTERGQKPVTKGRFQRLNNYSDLGDKIPVSSSTEDLNEFAYRPTL